MSREEVICSTNMFNTEFVLAVLLCESASAYMASAPDIPSISTQSTSRCPLTVPDVGCYNVPSRADGSLCLMATMGLQIRYKQGILDFQDVSLKPNKTKATGRCGFNGSDASLTLQFQEGSIVFTFIEANKKFQLWAVNMTIKSALNETIFSVAHSNLSLWEASVGSSYMCSMSRVYNIVDKLSLHTVELHLQPFRISNSSFSSAETCKAEGDESFFVPIAVGVCVSVLAFILYLAYSIGRKRDQKGCYQPF